MRSTVSNDAEARLLTLTHEILDAPRLSKIIADNDLYPAMRRSRPAADVVARMRKDIKVDVQDERERRGREWRSLVFTIGYTATDPTVAARVTNTLAALFGEENRRQREQQATGATEFLEGQLGELRTRLAGQEQRISAYKEQNLGELPEQRDVNLRTLERLQQQLQLAHENNRRATERRQMISQSLNDLDLASAMGGGGAAAGALNVAPGETAAARLSILRNELAALQTTYSDKYPDVIQMKEQIRLLEGRVSDEQKKAAAAAASPKTTGPAAATSRRSRDLGLAVQNPYVLSLMQQLDQANVEAKSSTDEITNLNRQLSVYQRRLEMTPKREQELALITRDYETTRDMFRSLLAKRGEAGVAADLEQRQKGETFRIIEPASLPERPAGPNRLRLLLVGVALALGAAGVAVVLAEQVDTSYRRADEMRATAGVPVLSTIPRIVTEADRLRRAAPAAAGRGGGGAAGSCSWSAPRSCVAHNNQSLVSVLTPDATAEEVGDVPSVLRAPRDAVRPHARPASSCSSRPGTGRRWPSSSTACASARASSSSPARSAPARRRCCARCWPALDRDTPSPTSTTRRWGIEGLLEYMLQDWGVKSTATTHAQRLFELNEFLIDQHRQRLSPVLVIDEAQNLSATTLEAVRLLSNFETTSQKLMQILLVGQPELRDTLNSPELRQLKQRIGLRCHIGPLSPEETRLYIRHRLRIAGATDSGIFTDAAIQRITEYSEGTPRVVNIVCDHCLLSGFADSKRRIDTGVVDEAIEYLEEGERPGLEAQPPDAAGPGPRRRVGRAGRCCRAGRAAPAAPGLRRQHHRLVRPRAPIGGEAP